MEKFKNISDTDLTIPNVGVVKAGEVVELPADFHNANFEKVEKKSAKKEEEKKDIKDL